MHAPLAGLSKLFSPRFFGGQLVRRELCLFSDFDCPREFFAVLLNVFVHGGIKFFNGGQKKGSKFMFCIPAY